MLSCRRLLAFIFLLVFSGRADAQALSGLIDLLKNFDFTALFEIACPIISGFGIDLPFCPTPTPAPTKAPVKTKAPAPVNTPGMTPVAPIAPMAPSPVAPMAPSTPIAPVAPVSSPVAAPVPKTMTKATVSSAPVVTPKTNVGLKSAPSSLPVAVPAPVKAPA